MSNFTATVGPVVRVEQSASLVGLGGIVVKGLAKSKGAGSAHHFHTVLRPSRIIFRNDGTVTIRSHAMPFYTVRLASVEVLAAWDRDDKVVNFSLVR